MIKIHHGAHKALVHYDDTKKNLRKKGLYLLISNDMWALKMYRKRRLAPVHEVIPSQNTEVTEIAAAGSSRNTDYMSLFLYGKITT